MGRPKLWNILKRLCPAVDTCSSFLLHIAELYGRVVMPSLPWRT